MPTDLDPRPSPSAARRWRSAARGGFSQARSWLSTHRAPTTVVGSLAAASLLLWGGLVIASGDGAAEVTRGQQAATSSASEGPADAAREPEAATSEPDPTPEPAPSPDPDQDQETDAAADTDELTPELVAMPEPLDPEDHAPLDPADADERWIVVLASYTRPSAAERDLRTRGSDEDAALLWSSHYGGLTPELWVVFTGPFRDREAALDAADARGGDAYARELAPPADS